MQKERMSLFPRKGIRSDLSQLKPLINSLGALGFLQEG